MLPKQKEVCGLIPSNRTFSTVESFGIYLHNLRSKRRRRVLKWNKAILVRRSLTPKQRPEVLVKAGKRCHLCGGKINGSDWQADHVYAHSTGGTHTIENYLPSHSLCNNYRWHYGTKEFQWILKLGVWLRTQIEKGTPIGQLAGQAFIKYDRRRAARCKQP